MYKIDDIVFVKPLKKEGFILKILNNNKYLVKVNEICINALENDLKHIDKLVTKNIKNNKKIKNITNSKAQNLYKHSNKIKTIDLHGVKYANLEEIVLREISNAVMQGYKQVHLMHGIGHEILKNALPKILDTISVISSYKETENPGVMAVYL